MFTVLFVHTRSAVVALVSQPEATTVTAPPTETADQFSAFGETIVQRLRKMGEEEALAAMAEISAVIFRPRSTFFSM